MLNRAFRNILYIIVVSQLSSISAIFCVPKVREAVDKIARNSKGFVYVSALIHLYVSGNVKYRNIY